MELLDKFLIKLHIRKPHPHDRDARKLPPPVAEALAGEGLDTSQLITFFKTDMVAFDRFGDAYVMLDEKGLYLAEFEETVGPRPPKQRGRKKHGPEYKPKLRQVVAIPLEDADELFTEKNLATGQLTYRKGEEYYNLCWFSLSCLADADRFRKIFAAVKEGEPYGLYLDEKEKKVCPKCGMPLPPGKSACPKCSGRRTTVTRLFSFFSEVRGKTAFIIGCILVSSVITIIIPQVSTRKLYDEVLNTNGALGYDDAFKALITVVLTLAALKIANQLFNVFYQYVIAGVLPHVIYGIKLKIFKAMQRLSVGFYTYKQTGSLMERVTRDSNNIYWFFVDGFPYIIVSLVTVIGVLAVMFKTSVKLTLMILSASVIILILYPVFNRVFRRLHHKVWVQNSRLTSKASDNINGHRIIKAFSKEQEEYEEFGEISDTLMRSEIKAANVEATTFPLLSVILYALGAAVLGYGGVLSIKYNELTIGQLLTFVVYLQMLQEPIEFLTWISNWWARCVDSAQRIFEITDTEPDVKDAENPVVLETFRGEIEMTGVQFEYEPARPIIRNLSLHVGAGEMLGIVGKTGAGKTTISNLIARLYDPQEGTVKIDGVDVKQLASKQLRQNIGIVSQDIFLFMGTIADNIRYARPDASEEEVIAAAKAAAAHDFITKLPDGYETRVGSGGRRLSGGERQRISIARTIIQNPKILILDEATAAMDTETERSIQNSLSALKKGRTTIAIAHRLSTLRDADKLAVIEEGRCIEYGTYRELMEKEGAYYKLFKLQEEALAFIGEDAAEEENDSKEGQDEHEHR